MSRCTDCGHVLLAHDAGFCYFPNCNKGVQCAHEPIESSPPSPYVRSSLPNPPAEDSNANSPEVGDDQSADRDLPRRNPPAPRVVVVYGTRPERIKLWPVQLALAEKGFEVIEWCSGQSKDLAPGGDEHRWSTNGLADGIANCMREFSTELSLNPPSLVIVQGDTATAFACAQAAFLARVPVAHVEAGLRTYQSEPWPEEAFRRQIAAIASYHFVPDEIAALNVKRECGRVVRVEEGLTLVGRPIAPENVFVVGNTVIDTLEESSFHILATLHRRENWGVRRQNALRTLSEFCRNNFHCDVQIIRHPNGTEDYLAVEEANMFLVNPMTHEELLAELRDADLIVTDSGGLQEEAAHFGIPCLVLRTSTERVALERTGAVTLVDPDDDHALRRELDAFLAKRRCYGDGTAGKQIADILAKEFIHGIL